MKKILTLGVILFSASIFSQEIVNENFNSLPIGNLGTDITGAIPSNGFITTANNGAAPTTGTNAGNSNFQIVDNDLDHQKVFQLTGTNGDKGSRNLWWNDFPSLWSSRDFGNNIIEVEFDFYTGAIGGTSENTKAFYVIDGTFTKILSGFLFNTKTLALKGVAYLEPGAPLPNGNYSFFLGAEVDLILPENTWVRLGFSFNKTTAQIMWKGPGFNKSDIGTPATVGENPERLLIASRSGSVAATPAIINTAAAIGLFDNVVVKATNSDSLLSTYSATLADSKLIVYPNPSNDIIKISSSTMIQSVEIYSMIGHKILQQFVDSNATSIDISKLAAGNYLLKTTVENQVKTTKIVVK